MLLFTYFHYRSLNLLKPKFLSICYLPPHAVQIFEKWGSKLAQKVSIFPTLWTNRIMILNHISSLKCKKRSHKQKVTHNFPLFKYFLNNLFLIVGRSTLVREHPMKSLPSSCPSIRPSVTKFSKDWVISFFWYCPWW